jgi:hypothetical protein
VLGRHIRRHLWIIRNGDYSKLISRIRPQSTEEDCMAMEWLRAGYFETGLCC